jgi:acyl carrier protein
VRFGHEPIAAGPDEQADVIDVSKAATIDVADVKAVVVAVLGLQGRADTLDAATPLLGSLPELDSMAVLELVGALEERFAIRIEDEDLTGEAFETLGSLTAVVAGKLR